MFRARIRYLLLPFLFLAAAGLTAIVSAAPPLSVTLNYFRGTTVGEDARLEWQTATELDTVGYRILRASAANGPFQELSEIGIIAARGGPVSGDTYEALDTNVVTGQTYWYRLIEIEQNSNEQILDTLKLQIGNEPTATLDAIATSDNGDDDANEGETQPTTSNTTATSTPSPSPGATGQSGANTPRPATVTPTVTVQASTTNDAGGPLEARPAGGLAEAAGTTDNTRPTAVAQVTEAYPDPPPADDTPAQGYPDEAPEDDVEVTPEEPDSEESYPAAPANGITPARPTSAGDNVVGGLPESEEGVETQEQQSGNLSRILLWMGFVAALIIFIAGAAFSILLSTRKQRQDIS